MAKKDENGNVVGNTRVVWQLSNDGLQPSPTPYGFMARNPVQRVIPPGGSAQINLQVAANLPMIAFPTRAHADDVTVSQVIQPGQEVVVTVHNRSLHVPMVLDDKEPLVSLYPMAFDGVGTVG